MLPDATMRHTLSCLLLAACLLVAPGIVQADDASTYQGSTLVNSQGGSEKTAALQRALAQVIVKITGQRDAPSQPQVRGLLGTAAQIAQDSRYSAEAETINGAPIYRQRLTARFDRSAVDALIAGAGLPVWPSPRAPIVLWLVIDDGHGARMVGATHVNVAKSLTDRASDRGLVVILPAANPAEETAAASAIAQPQAVVALSSAYGSPVQLVGKLARTSGGWNADWVLLDGGVELGRWNDVNPDARLAMANAADIAADTLAKKYARVVAGGPPGTFTVSIDGVRTADDYVRAMGYLESLGIVRRIVLVRVVDARLDMQLDLATGLEGFRNVVAVGQVLELASDGANPVFRLHP